MSLILPRLYAIVDCGSLTGSPAHFAAELVAGGAELLQYRNKDASPQDILSQTREIWRAVRSRNPDVRLIINDHAELCLATGFDGVHVGQNDLSADLARAACPQPKLVGVSTHTVLQVMRADQGAADYIAIGPVFPTTSKTDAAPVVGLEGVRHARKLTKKPLVAIGGITLENCRDVIEAGADSVAVLSALVAEPRKSVEDFLRILG